MVKFKQISQKLKTIVKQKNIIKNILKKIDNESISFNYRWLNENLDKVKILDASWHLPNANRNSFEEYKKTI